MSSKLLQGLHTAGTHTISERSTPWNGCFENHPNNDRMYTQVFDVTEAPLAMFGFGFVGTDSAVLEAVNTGCKGEITHSAPLTHNGRMILMDVATDFLVLSIPGRYRWRLLTGDPSLVYIEKNHSVMLGQDYFTGMMTGMRTPTEGEAAIIWMGGTPLP